MCKYHSVSQQKLYVSEDHNKNVLNFQKKKKNVNKLIEFSFYKEIE